MLEDLPYRDAGSLRATYDAVDWAATPLGDPSGWSPTLRATLDIALNTRYAVTLMWGPEMVLLYNEAYVELIGQKHPDALGRPAQEVFPEAWSVIGPMLQSVLDGEGPTYVRDQPLPLVRAGFLEECHFTYSYSPVHGPDGRVQGAFDIVSETTGQVVAERRLRLLGRLKDALGTVESADQVRSRAHALLADATADLAAVRIEVVAAHGGAGSRAGQSLGQHDMVVQEDQDGHRARLGIGTGTPYAGSVLEVVLSPRVPLGAPVLDFLRLVGATLSRSLEQVARIQAERSISAALQRSLLADPPQRPGMTVAVRYQPAANDAQVGGDWYDAFVLPGGSLLVAVGDVAGHDEGAAASMAQLRNLVRGIGWTAHGTPAEVLRRLDSTMDGLALDVVATAQLVQAERDGERLVLTWSSAGHPPPVHVRAEGRAEVLLRKPDLLLGIDHATDRTDHRTVLEPGDSVVLYTDGLVERRGAPITEGLDWLETELTGCAHLTPEQVCDHLLDLVGDDVEDDVALLVLHHG
ncbi:SpoIIE family protein phosphatase [Nocardioides sp. NPDC092400]|uniref:SpoIIE family protein phosphatase n=1 Tax=Nocardioides sp. NPDC092400 TaxID=3155196 RepID=UPI0034446DEF